MRIDPFVVGIAIGGVGIAATILITNYLARKMADSYEARIAARDKRIRILLDEVQDLKAQRARENTLRQIQKPVGGR